MNIAESVSEIVRRVESEVPEDDRTSEVLRAIRALPGIVELNGPLTFRSGQHEIQVGLTGNLDKTAGALKELAPLKLSIAPELVAQHSFAPGEGVLVSRYAAVSDGEKLVPLKPNEGGIEAKAKERARQDFEKLAANGLIHGYAGRGFAQWLATSDKKSLALDGWTSLRAASAEERVEQLERIDGLLARIA